MNWLQMLGGGMPQMDNPYQVDAAIQRAQQQQQQAQYLQNPQLIGGGNGPLSVIAGLAQMLKGKALDRQSGETLNEALKRRFDMDNQRAQAEAEKARLADEAKWQRELQRIDAEQAAKAKYRKPDGPDIRTIGNQLVQVGPDGKAQVLYSAPNQQQPQQPSFDERLIASLPPEQQQQAILSRLGIAPKEKTLDAQDIKLIQAEDQRRVSLDNATDLVNRLTDLTNQGVGGPIAASGWNPFTNRATPAGQAIESYDAMAAQLADEITRLTRIPGVGSQSDAELRAALAAIPTSDKNEATRMQMLKQIAQKIERLKNSPTFFEISRGQHGERPQPMQPQAGATGDPLIDKYL